MKEKEISKKGIIIIVLIIIVIAIVAIALGRHFLSNPDSNNEDGIQTLGQGDKNITVEVIVSEEDIRVFRINTSADTLLKALQEQNLIDGEQQDYGYYITAIDGVVANPEKSEWWSISVDNIMIDTIIDKTPIKDGDKFSFELIDGSVTSSASMY